MVWAGHRTNWMYNPGLLRSPTTVATSKGPPAGFFCHWILSSSIAKMGTESDVTTGACCARLEFESNSPRAKQTAKRNMGASGGGKVKNLHSATQSIANPATFPDRMRRADIGSRPRPHNHAAYNSSP